MAKLKKLITKDIMIEMYLLFLLLFWSVESPYVIANEIPKIISVTRKVKTLFFNISTFDNPIFAQITSYGSDAYDMRILKV
jgi:hypothetical protein